VIGNARFCTHSQPVGFALRVNRCASPVAAKFDFLPARICGRADCLLGDAMGMNAAPLKHDLRIERALENFSRSFF
jgi:hypothetical protein